MKVAHGGCAYHMGPIVTPGEAGGWEDEAWPSLI